MKKIKRRILGIINIILPIILGIILLFADLSESVIYIMVMTLIIGWAIPFAVPIVTGLTIIYRKQPKLALIFNIVKGRENEESIQSSFGAYDGVLLFLRSRL